MPHHSIPQTTLAVLLTVSFAISACSGDDDSNGGVEPGTAGYCGDATQGLVSGSGVPANPATPLLETSVSGSACNAVEREFTPEPGVHTDVPCVDVEYSTNPPCMGMHYGIWPAYRVYDEAVPRGFWVHGLEHGAVALTYSCSDCADEVAEAEALLDEIGADPVCVAGMQPSRRTLLTPDPRLDARWAASSWGFTLTADCFEPEVFRAFVAAHRGHGPEDICGEGLDVSQPPP